MRTGQAVNLDLIPVHRAVVVLAAELAIPELDAVPLLVASGIPTRRIGDLALVQRADVVAYAHHLAEQAQASEEGAR